MAIRMNRPPTFSPGLAPKPPELPAYVGSNAAHAERLRNKAKGYREQIAALERAKQLSEDALTRGIEDNETRAANRRKIDALAGNTRAR
jgi:hypothetical protein